MSKLCVDKLCVSKLYVSKLCVNKLCVDKLCVSKLCVCVCVSKLCLNKVCVRKERREAAGVTRDDGGSAQPKKRPKKSTQRCGEQLDGLMDKFKGQHVQSYG